MKTNTRGVAVQVLTQVLQKGHSLTVALDQALASVESGQDRAFIQALCYGVCRHYHYLDFILNQLLAKPLKEMDVKVLALIGLYQLRFMRVKTHAAVSETVHATRKKPWAKGLINALLRTYLRDQETLEQAAKQIPPVVNSHPDWLIQHIQRDWPEQAKQILTENNQQPPMVLRVNLAKISREQYLLQLNSLDITAVAVDFCPSALMLDKPVPVEQLPDFFEGLVSVQDTAAQLAAGLLGLDTGLGLRVLDVCAAPGGKTAHILETQPHLSALVAVDIDTARMQRVRDNLQRLQLSATLLVGDAAKPLDWWDGQLFDRILLDAPCSATGVIRRHPDIKLLRRAEDIAQLQILQKSILEAVWPLLAPGGLLLYATCSVLKQENEQQVLAFLAAHSDAFIELFSGDWGRVGTYGRQILPGDQGMDGFYYARLGKRR
ncbi:MAG: 16S rRNA (cytosine(967)-C(5))-methyltransferase RsmB [Methylovulum sp.]|nr:16S rRNA (cytosine(967)-C(5))-methyltransferase RsmB [Methylovulum sp.]